jgi:SH3 domain protein
MMERRMMKRVLIAVCLAALAGTAVAETRYVSDELEVTLRQGESTSHRITSMLKSGTPVEVLGTNKSTGYSRVRAPNGKEGYVLARLLTEEPGAREQLDALKARVASMETEPARLSAELESVTELYTALQAEHDEALQAKTALEQELAGIRQTAANAINIANERTDLQKQVATLSRRLSDVEQENRELTNDVAQDWFLIGGGVLLGGLLLGLILPNLRLPRRKTSWDRL